MLLGREDMGSGLNLTLLSLYFLIYKVGWFLIDS